MTEDSLPGIRIGVDIGGTFTDLVFLEPDGHLEKRKLPSTPDDYARAIVDGVRDYLTENAVKDGGQVAELVHATTVATNAILERKGVRTALITTAGFRDVLELRRIRIPSSYDVDWQKPLPLVPRGLRYEVTERLDAQGAILKKLNINGLDRIIDSIIQENVTAVAICFLHAYRNPVHERAAGAYLRQRLPDIHISLSSEVLPEIQEFERSSTTVVNAYVGPLIDRYLTALRTQLRDIDVTSPILVMQSNGGLVPARTAAERPVTVIESGPAAGVVAATRAARAAGHDNVITLDMGGTTTKASIIERGQILRARDYEVGAPVSVSSRLVRGGGYMLRIPVIDISEVGAGGGSIAEIDDAGALRVGPRSAGASPGPVCYGMGNEAPTVTDANLVLGYLHDGSLAGGALQVDGALARNAIANRIAEPFGMALLEAAHGIHTVANSNMVRAIKSVSVERGRDPADFVMMAFGGAGPIHAAGIARALGIRRVLVPPAPGLFSAFGLLRAAVEHHTTRTVLTGTRAPEVSGIEDVFEEMRRNLLKRISEEGIAESSVSFSAMADMRYAGQSSEIMVPFAHDQPLAAALTAAEGAFEAEYERSYGHRSEHATFELVNCHLIATVARGVEQEGVWHDTERASTDENSERPVYFGPEAGQLQTPILSRAALSATARPGPVIIEEYDSTVVVPPESSVTRDDAGNIVIDVEQR